MKHTINTYKYPISLPLLPNQIVVFGSNTQGRHGKGMALWCVQYAGAVYGQSTGLQGQSYAIITKDLTKSIHPSVPVADIITQIRRFYDIAINSNKEYLIAYGPGSNLNGYTSQQMADMFVAAGSIPDNVLFADVFAPLLQL